MNPSEIVWLQSLALPPLETLDLHDCNLTSSILSRRYANFSSLSYLDLGLKDFTNGLANWLFNLSKDHLSDFSQTMQFERSNARFLRLSESNVWETKLYVAVDINSEDSAELEYKSQDTSAPRDYHLTVIQLLASLSLEELVLVDCHLTSFSVPSVKDDVNFSSLSGSLNDWFITQTIPAGLPLSDDFAIPFKLRREIRGEIGEMKDLEYLDFSHSSLQGNIPQSMSSLSFLGVLNLSYNKFMGQFPLGTQLQNFDALSYIGNPKLCGPPLQKNCTTEEKADNTKHVEENEDDAFLKSLYLGLGIGFTVGFWVVCGSLFLNKA
ncbi:receptor like protein 21-like [Neltuma alba]|uniref:receptor like protein 21-like n=1 Tax=Neltuma alba TaxID=207710 RepID=UPI0010A510C0|nr:receptor like protein 21-like [Prosopis alba]